MFITDYPALICKSYLWRGLRAWKRWRKPVPGPTPVTLERGLWRGLSQGDSFSFPSFFVPEFSVVVEEEGSSVRMSLGSSRRSGRRRRWQHCPLNWAERCSHASHQKHQTSCFPSTTTFQWIMKSHHLAQQLPTSSVCLSFLVLGMLREQD